MCFAIPKKSDSSELIKYNYHAFMYNKNFMQKIIVPPRQKVKF